MSAADDRTVRSCSGLPSPQAGGAFAGIDFLLADVLGDFALGPRQHVCPFAYLGSGAPACQATSQEAYVPGTLESGSCARPAATQGLVPSGIMAGAAGLPLGGRLSTIRALPSVGP